MSRPRLVVPVSALVISAVALTGCTSSTTSKPGKTFAPTSSATAPAAVGGTTVAPSALADKLTKGLADTTSTHLVVSAALAGQTLTGSGDAALAAGAIDKADLQQQLPSGLGSIRIVVVGGKTYAKLPGALASSSAKPWVILTTHSSSIVVAQIASTVQPILAVASPSSLVAFARSASSVRDLGPATITGGATATRYRVVVDTTKLPASLPSSISGGGRTTIPLDIYLDAQGRPVEVSGTFSISGQKVTPTIMLSRFDEPVSVSAPPASQIDPK